MPYRTCPILALLLLAAAVPAHAGEVRAAVAGNFKATIEALEPRFEAATGHELRVSTGSTGSLYAQIRNGAPFDAFLAADRRRPRKLAERGLAVPGSRFTYAQGRLALWSADPERVNGPQALRGEFRRLAIANPRTAPYGLAAQQALQSLGQWRSLQGRIIQGQNINQAHQFVASGNAELGFVALSQLSAPGRPERGSRWLVPQQHHAPIRQQAVLLERAADHAPAQALLRFLQGPEAAELIRRFGYTIPDDAE